MTFRPVPARWFEILVARNDLLKTVDTLARSGGVELETYSETTKHITMPDLRDRFEDYNRLLRRYQPYWPQEDLHPTSAPGQPHERLDKALTILHTWQQNAVPIIDELENLQAENTELGLFAEMLANMQEQMLNFSLLTQAGPTLAARIFILPPTTRIAHLPPAALSIQVKTDLHIFLLVVGPIENIDSLQRDLILQKGRTVAIPQWLDGQLPQVIQATQLRQQTINQQINKLQHQLERLAKKHKLRGVLGDIQQLEWFLIHIADLPVSENFAWITGWTNDVSANNLEVILKRNQVRAVVHYPPPPTSAKAPMVLQNPWWSQPFELFAKLLGTPARNELDPSPLLVIIVPLLFGYMFGDVGQGFLLLLAGWILKSRYPVLKIFIGCGISSILFGLAFGSVFALENIIEPLWVRPIEQPLVVLFTPMGAGVLILLLGLVLQSIQAYWQGELRHWLLVDAAVILMYLSFIASFFYIENVVVFLIGLFWYLTGSVLSSTENIGKTLSAAIGQMLESVLQLIINTISFIRVGAFALAHAGLSVALVVLANAIGNIIGVTLILIIGNLFIILLEGLVVSIQTTRLVLFEFFIRFLRGTGRMFQPLTVPMRTSAKPKGRKQ